MYWPPSWTAKYSLSSHLIVIWWNSIAQLLFFYFNACSNIFNCAACYALKKDSRACCRNVHEISGTALCRYLFTNAFSECFRDCFYYHCLNKVQFWYPDIRIEQHGTLTHGLSNGERISRLHISKTSVSTPSSVSCIDWLMALFVECASLDVSPFWPPRCICVCVFGQ